MRQRKLTIVHHQYRYPRRAGKACGHAPVAVQTSENERPAVKVQNGALRRLVRIGKIFMPQPFRTKLFKHDDAAPGVTTRPQRVGSQLDEIGGAESVRSRRRMARGDSRQQFQGGAKKCPCHGVRRPLHSRIAPDGLDGDRVAECGLVCGIGHAVTFAGCFS
ncbi:Uncharacterised protein [Mycobacteroides abscessus subsp. abscessus]|nr:Uncharacterised protein [Mycobacteroides abscessus subsp. abscessus]